MSLFRFTGRDAQGGKVSGCRNSGSADTLANELLAQNIIPLTIEAQAEQGDGLLALLAERLRSKKADLLELIIFCRQMHSLSKAGVPIIRAIGGLAESHRNQYFREVLLEVRSDLEGGMTPTGSTFSLLPGAPAGESIIAVGNLPATGFRFAYASPQQRVYLAQTVVAAFYTARRPAVRFQP